MHHSVFRENVWLLRALAAAGFLLMLAGVYKEHTGIIFAGIAAVAVAAYLWRARGQTKVKVDERGAELSGDLDPMKPDDAP